MESLILLTIIWLPVLLVWFENICNDLNQWQSNEYRLKNLLFVLRFDYQVSERHRIEVGAKLLAFGIAVFALVFSNWQLVSFMAALAYAVYLAQSFNFIERVLQGRFQKLLVSPRNLAVLTTLMILLFGVVFVVTYPIATGNLITGYQVTLIYPDQLVQNSIITAPSFMIFLALVTILAFSIDLALPALTALAIVITSPLDRLQKQVELDAVRLAMSSLPNQTYILIIGNYAKGTTAELFKQLVSEKHRPVRLEYQISTLAGLLEQFLAAVKPHHDVVIIEIDNDALPQSVGNIARLINPVMIAVPNIREIEEWNHQHQRIKSQVINTLQYLKPGGVLAVNGDDPDCLAITEQNNGNEILFFKSSSYERVKTSLAGNSLTLNALWIEDIKVDEGRIDFILNTNLGQYPVSLNHHEPLIIDSILPAISLAVGLGMDIDIILTELSKVSKFVPLLAQYDGISETTLIDASQKNSLTSLNMALNQLYRMAVHNNRRRILLSKGITSLGPNRKATYAEFLGNNLHSLDILFTQDKQLADAAKAVKPDMRVLYARSYAGLFQQVINTIQPEDAILIQGKFPKWFSQKLRGNE